MVDDPKATVRAFVQDVQNDGNIAAAGDYIAADVVDHSALPGLPPGLEGVQATGRRVTINVIDIVRVEDGKMVEHWNAVDLLGALQQMEAAP